MKKLFFLIVPIFLVLVTTQKTYAFQNASASSAKLQTNLGVEEDYRVRILRNFLTKNDSPLAVYAPDFVENAKKYNLDWKLVAAISGLESTFGKQIPYNSYNGWGWGVYGDNVIRFSSWSEGIKTVSQGLRENFIDKWGAKDIYEIGRLYAASPTWAVRVVFLMGKIEAFAMANPQDALPLSL